MNITMTELLNLNHPNIIDIRSNVQYDLGHIPNAKNINKVSLIANHEKYLDKNEIYYIYCNTGSTSFKVCQILTKLGYKTINVLGGYKLYNSVK